MKTQIKKNASADCITTRNTEGKKQQLFIKGNSASFLVQECKSKKELT